MTERREHHGQVIDRHHCDPCCAGWFGGRNASLLWGIALLAIGVAWLAASAWWITPVLFVGIGAMLLRKGGEDSRRQIQERDLAGAR